MLSNQKTELTGTREERILQILQMAGWYEGRCVDISKIESYYQTQRVSMTLAAKDFFREYLGIANAWYIAIEVKTKGGKSPAYGPDFWFDLYTHDGIDDVSELVFDVFDEEYPIRTHEQLLIDKTSGEMTTLVGEIGYHFPARLWIGESGTLYALHYDYDKDKVYVFNSMVEFIKSELRMCEVDSAAVFYM